MTEDPRPGVIAGHWTRLRPGRFDRIIEFGAMDIGSWRKMLGRALAGAEIRPEDMNYLVEATNEYTGAQIEELVNTLYILAVQEDAMGAQTCRVGRGGCLDSGEQDTPSAVTGRILLPRSLIDAALEEVHVERKAIGFHAA